MRALLALPAWTRVLAWVAFFAAKSKLACIVCLGKDLSRAEALSYGSIGYGSACHVSSTGSTDSAVLVGCLSSWTLGAFFNEVKPGLRSGHKTWFAHAGSALHALDLVPRAISADKSSGIEVLC